MAAKRTIRTLIIGIMLLGEIGLLAGLAWSIGSTSVEPTPTSTAVLRREDQIAQEFITQYDFVTAEQDCPAITGPDEMCAVLTRVEQITRPEWEELLPKTQFYLVKYEFYAQDTHRMSAVLIIEQDGQRYTPKTFDQLLEVNEIVVTNENRELIAKAFVLTALSNGLAEKIVFSDWKEGEWPGVAGRKPNYSITVWTKIAGMKVQWFFWFKNERLLYVDHSNAEYYVGDYIDPSFYPQYEGAYLDATSYYFREK